MSDAAASPVLEARQIFKQYPTGDEVLHVLRGVDFSIAEGDFVSITGESGSGKSTFLQILGGLDTANAGEVFVRGIPITKLKEGPMAEIRNRHLGYIFQSHHLLVEFTALENIMIAWRIYNRDVKKGLELAEELLRKTGVYDRRHHKAGELSGGEMQRVSIARALVNQPGVILADEPTGNLDEGNALRVIELLKAICREQKTAVVLVTHSKTLPAYCDRNYALKGGLLQRV